MNTSRLVQSAAVVVFSLLMLAVPESARGDIPQAHSAAAPILSQREHRKVTTLADAFAGLDLSKEQQAEVEKIRQDAEARIASIDQNQDLNQDQKDAMIQGCTRLEYSQIFRALTPAQKQVVRERVRALEASEPPNQHPNAPRN